MKNLKDSFRDDEFRQRRMPWQPRYGRVPIPSHVLSGYYETMERENRKQCGKCRGYANSSGVIQHESWCEDWGCPNCGGKSFSSEGLTSICDSCGNLGHG